MPGIKVDTGAKDLAGFPGEKITEGLDGLRDRMHAFHELGLRFTKWRAVITIDGDNRPTSACMSANAHALARYAALAQEAGLVPMVEPEILIDGNHSLDQCYDATATTLQLLYDALYEHRVHLPGTLLKTSMVLAGKDHSKQSSIAEVADATLRCLRAHVPSAVPGIVFLSGGQSPQQAAANLNAINEHGNEPWALSYSFGRAIQQPALDAWAKNPGDTKTYQQAQQLLTWRSKLCSAASLGDYDKHMEQDLAAAMVAGRSQ